jgi:hypothetical protein
MHIYTYIQIYICTSGGATIQTQGLVVTLGGVSVSAGGIGATGGLTVFDTGMLMYIYFVYGYICIHIYLRIICIWV